MINVAVAGAGYIGSIHAEILTDKIKNTRVIAVTDNIEKKGMELAEKIGAVYYSDYDSLIKNQDIDVIAVCTPTFLHAGMVIKAAHAGKNIFCEKPLALSLVDANEMIKAVQDNQVKAMAGHVLRFWPVYVRVKQIIESGDLGKPRHVYCERLIGFPDWADSGWNEKEKLGGGGALDVQIHDLDYIIWLFGKPEFVKSQGVYDASFGGWKHIVTNMGFEGELSGSVQAGWGFPQGFPFTVVIRIMCENGTIEWISRAGKLFEKKDFKNPLIIYKTDRSILEEEPDQTDAFFLEWKYFIDCLESGSKVENATFEDGRNALEVALASIRSAGKKSVVKMK